MSLSVVTTIEESLTSAPVIGALREGVAGRGSAVLLVPSFTQALDAQRWLAAQQGLALAVTTTTPSAWVAERWEVWGDGRTIAGGIALSVVAGRALSAATPDELGPIEPSPGVVDVLVQLVSQALPWLPLTENGQVDEGSPQLSRLTGAEIRLLGLAGLVARRLSEEGFVGAAEVSALVPKLLEEAEVRMPRIVVAGFSQMSRKDRELVRALGDLTDVTVVVRLGEGPAFEQARRFAQWFGCATLAVPAAGANDEVRTLRDGRLGSLQKALFANRPLEAGADEPVELLLAAGPVAEAELVARRVGQLSDGRQSVVIAVPDVSRAARELVPKLVSRGLALRLEQRKPLMSCPSARAFFSFARTVAHLAELEQGWPAPVEGIDGPMVQLGDMSWWPPRELSDFLLSDISHVGASQGWRADASWRGNRLLSPERVLAMLQSERDTSPSVARATTELLRGRVGTAASKLLAPYVFGNDEGPEAGDGAETPREAHRPDDAADDEAKAVLQAVLQLAGTLRELGVTADPSAQDHVSLSELVSLLEEAAEGATVVSRLCTNEAAAAATVRIMTHRQASILPPASVDVLALCGLTTAEAPISAGDDLLRALLEQMEVEPKADPMAAARASFAALVGLPRHRLVLERALHDADAKPTYPSVMLTELLAAYGLSASERPDKMGLAATLRPETSLGENLSVTGVAPQGARVAEPAPSGLLSGPARAHVFVPQDGRDQLPGGKPIISASQVETYLDCPYKWFSLRRLRLGTVDAGYTGMEMGTFAHRVMEVTHRELLAQALEREQPGCDREELLAAIERDPARHVAASRVGEDNLEVAREVLSHEFELHRQHMYMVRRPRQAQQLLVAHTSADRSQEDQLREDLLSSLAYQTRILEGFEPRLFEWSFGRRDDLVEYAGAYFTGTVDRIDVSPHGTAVIIDYKHKGTAGFAAEYDALQEGVLEGERLPNRVQSLIYAQVVRRAFEGRLRLVGTVYLSTKQPHALAGAADENVVDQVFGRVSAQRMARVSVPRTAEGEPGMSALLDRTEELVARQVEQMLAGNVEAHPRDVHSCDFCPVMQCERRVAR